MFQAMRSSEFAFIVMVVAACEEHWRAAIMMLIVMLVATHSEIGEKLRREKKEKQP